MISEIIIANLSCGGCVNTISKNLIGLNGMQHVEVDLEENKVTATHNEHLTRDEITTTLKSLGYPEATEKNGLLMMLQSKISCAKGKFSAQN